MEPVNVNNNFLNMINVCLYIKFSGFFQVQAIIQRHFLHPFNKILINPDDINQYTQEKKEKI
jgi:hypothetical protein